MIDSVFGSFQVIERDFTKKAAAKYWKIKCQYCGLEKSIRADALKKNPICKCQKDIMINNIFGDFLVLSRAEEKAKDNCIIYKCQCIHCGNIENVASNRLRAKVKFCSNCHIRKSTLIDMSGQRYGDLKVLYRDNSSEHTGHQNDAYWFCECLNCGSIKSIRGISLRKGLTHSCGCILSKGEALISHILTQNNINFAKQYTFPDLYTTQKNCKLRFDFAIFDSNNQLSHLIEYDGEQHFIEGVRESGWNTFENHQQTVKRDNIKNEYCKQHNIKLIRIKYNEKITLNKLLGKEEKNDIDE